MCRWRYNFRKEIWESPTGYHFQSVLFIEDSALFNQLGETAFLFPLAFFNRFLPYQYLMEEASHYSVFVYIICSNLPYTFSLKA